MFGNHHLVPLCPNWAYKTSLQRLNIYNIILGLICEVAYALQIEVHFNKTEESVQDTFCEALGFLYVYTRFMWYTFIVLHTNCLLFFALRLRMGKPLSPLGSKCIKLICIVGSVLAPLTYIWLPFQNGMYGLDNQFFCWIQYIKFVNGTCIVNNRNLIVVNSVFVGMSAEVILVCFVVCVVFCFLHKIVQNRQSASLFKRSQYVIGINIRFFCVLHYFYHNHICEHTADYLVHFSLFFCAFSSLLTSVDIYLSSQNYSLCYLVPFCMLRSKEARLSFTMVTRQTSIIFLSS